MWTHMCAFVNFVITMVGLINESHSRRALIEGAIMLARRLNWPITPCVPCPHLRPPTHHCGVAKQNLGCALHGLDVARKLISCPT